MTRLAWLGVMISMAVGCSRVSSRPETVPEVSDSAYDLVGLHGDTQGEYGGLSGILPVVYLHGFVKDYTSGTGEVEPFVLLRADFVSSETLDRMAYQIAETMTLYRVSDRVIVGTKGSVGEIVETESGRETRISLASVRDLDENEWYEVAMGIPPEVVPFVIEYPSSRTEDGRRLFRFRLGHDAVIRVVLYEGARGAMTIRFSERLFQTEKTSNEIFSVKSASGGPGFCESRVPDSVFAEVGATYINADCYDLPPTEPLTLRGCS